MYFISFITFIAYIIVGLRAESNEDILSDNGIYILNKDNFDNFIKVNDVLMVEFYAPWCGHCKSFTPIYSEAAEQLKSNDYHIPLCKVDATVETDLASRFDISGYPTLKFFKFGNVYDYDGDRTAVAIVNFMKKVSSSDWAPPKSNVLTLSKENFTEIVTQSGYILVEFFAPWCGHCKRLAPEYAKAATILMKQDPPIMLAAVDATKETDLAKQYDVTGYPTLKLFRNNKVSQYNGPRYADGIVEWMINNRANAAARIESVSQLKKIINPQKVLLLGLFSNEDDLLFSKFIDATNQVRDDFSSAYSFNSDILKLYKLPINGGVGNLVLLRPDYLSNKFEKNFVEYNYNEKLNHTAESLISFFESSMFPLVAEYNTETSRYLDKFSKEYLCIAFLTVDFSVHHRAATKKWLGKIAEIANKYKNNIQFAIADDEKQLDKLKELRLDDSGEELNVGCIKEGNIKYRMPPMEEFDSEEIIQFIDNILSDALFPLLKSAPIPKLPLSSGITTVVGDTYKNLINDISKDAIIILYRSPCEKCKASKEVLSALSSKLSGKSLGFFSMDLSQNDLPLIDGLENIDSQPSLYLVVDRTNLNPDSLIKKKMIKFKGDQLSESEIRSFIIEHSKNFKDEL